MALFVPCMVIFFAESGFQLAKMEIISMAGFNMQVFGDTKFQNHLATHVFVDQAVSFDLMVFQEIRDIDASSIYGLFEKIQQVDSRYDMLLSERLGRTSSKEQYAIIYRTHKLHLITSYIPTDPFDLFEREPFVAQFCTTSATKISPPFCFAAIGTHIKASSALASFEIDALYSVSEAAKGILDVQDVIIIGDLNCACSYVSTTKRELLKLSLDTTYAWAIGDNQDTTTKQSTDCAYDRIVFSGVTLRTSFQRSGVRKLQQQYNLNEDEAQDISDHYPVYAIFDIN